MFNLALLAKQASARPGHHFETPTDNVALVPVRQNARRPACGLGMPAAPWPWWPSATARKRAAASAQAGRHSAMARERAAASAQARWGTACAKVAALRASLLVVLMLWTFLGSAQRLVKFVERLRLCDGWALNSMTVSGSATAMP